jgi:ubiquinone/menaquinone biosynthesis C-methylase UbiE
MLRKLYYFLPPSLRYHARKLFFAFKAEGTQFHNGIRIPKSGEIFTGRGDFLGSGMKTKNLLVKHANLREHSTVLDIGSGLGRIAIPLTDILKASGTYHGTDIIKKGVDYCQEHISSKFSNFHFHHTPAFNDLYNSTGADGAQVKIPIAAASIDVAVANSVFTHLVKSETENYLAETSRLLKKGGRAYYTFFVIDSSNKNRVLKATGSPEFSFRYSDGVQHFMDQKVKRANVAFDIDFLESLFEKMGLQVNSFNKGHWRADVAENQSIDFQDVFILEKR